MDQPEESAKPIAVSVDDARGALGPKETSSGDTLMPMLIVALALIIVSITVVLFVV